MKAPLHIREVNRAREYYNPMRGLDMPRLVSLLDQGERGQFSDLQKLNRTMEKRQPTLRALKSRRLGALKKLDWDVKLPAKLPDAITLAQATAQQKFLRSRYEQIVNLPQAMEFLALSTFRGFSHLEPHYLEDEPSLPVVRLQPVPQWHWVRGFENFEWRYDVTARNAVTTAVPVDPASFIIREVDDPLCEIALICGVRRGAAGKDWSAFMADYSIPSAFAMLGENTPLDKVKEWLELMKAVTNNSRGALPPGSKIQALELANYDGAQFEKYIDHQDKELVLAGTGGLLTMLTASTGMNSGQADTHETAFNVIALSDAKELSALMQEQFDKPLLAREFPSQVPVAYFELAALDEEDLDQLANRLRLLAQAGLIADPAEITEKVGIKLERGVPPSSPAAAADVKVGAEPAAVAPVKPFANRAGPAGAAQALRFEANAKALLAEADQAAFAPVLALVEAVRTSPDATAYQNALAKLSQELPAIERALLRGHPEREAALEAVLATAFVNGVASAAPQLAQIA